jgi:SRSO17 transposase
VGLRPLDGERLREAGVPEEQMGFAKKGELARRMLERAFDAGVPASWVSGEEVYGQSTKLRRWLEEGGKSYVLGVARSHPLWVALEGGGVPAQRRAEEIVAEAPAETWEKVRVGEKVAKGLASTSGRAGAWRTRAHPGGHSGC